MSATDLKNENSEAGLAVLLPFAPIKQKDLGARKDIRAVPEITTGKDYYIVPLDRIIVRDNFNVREDYGDLTALAKSLIENGQELPGFADVMAGGYFLLTDGYRRLEAFKLAESWGIKDIGMKLFTNEKNTTEEDRIFRMFITQDNKQLTNNEVAKLFSMLVSTGWKQKDIAKKIGKTDAYVSQMLSYSKESDVVKQMVAEDKISVSAVIKLQKQIPDQEQRTEAIQKAITTKTVTKTVVENTPAIKNTDSSTDNDASEFDNRNNVVSGSKQEIDTIENASGPAIIEYTKENKSAIIEPGKENKVTVRDVTGKVLTRRQRLEGLAAAIDKKYELELDEEELKDLFELIAEYI